MLSYFYSQEYTDERLNVLKEILPNIELKIEDMEKVQKDKTENNPSLNKEIQKKKILVKCLKYYYSI
jgi:hypothetical protein